MKGKRIFSLLTVLALLASLLTVPALAAETKTLTLREDWRLTQDLDLAVPVYHRIDRYHLASCPTASGTERDHLHIHADSHIGIFRLQHHEVHIERPVIYEGAERLGACHVITSVGHIGHDSREGGRQHCPLEIELRLFESIPCRAVAGTGLGYACHIYS